MSVFSMVLAGVATGALLGMLVGLSASPVVATLVGGVVTLAMAVLGFSVPAVRVPGPAGVREAQLRQLGVAALAIACLCGVLAGALLRARDTFAPTPKELVARWTEAGYSQARALEIVAEAAHAVGVVSPSAGSAQGGRPATSTVLFGTAGDDCRRLTPSDYTGVGDLQRAFLSQGGKWAPLAKLVEDVPDRQRRALLVAGWSLACQ
jgi:hypothetical protein